MMTKKMIVGITTLMSIGLMASSAHAAERYNLKIETGFVILESCTAGGQAQISHIELLLSDASAAQVGDLSSAVGRIRVCSPFTDPVRENIPLPLPIALMKKAASLPSGKTIGYDLKASQFSGYFTNQPTPDYLQAQKLPSGAIQFTYMTKATHENRIGPIRAFLGTPASMANVKGYQAGKSLPLSRIEIEVPDKNVMLKANIVSIDSAQ